MQKLTNNVLEILVVINKFFEIAMCDLGAFKHFEGARADF
jgi:hypothetical protein